MKALSEFFNANLWLRSDGSRWDLSVGQVSILDYLLVHFDSYPLPSILSAEFLIWQEFVIGSLDRHSFGERHSNHPDHSLRLQLGKYNALVTKLEELRAKRRREE